MIDINKYRIYLKYDGDSSLMFEPWANKKDKDKLSPKEFQIIDEFISNLKMLESNTTSDDYGKKLFLENKSFQSQMTEEVYNLIVKKKTMTEIEIKKTWNSLYIPCLIGLIVIFLAVLFELYGSKKSLAQTLPFYGFVLGLIFVFMTGYKMIKFKIFLIKEKKEKDSKD